MSAHTSGLRGDVYKRQALVTSVVIAAAMLVFGRLVLGLFISGDPAEAAASMDIAYRYLAIMSLCLPILYMLHIYRSALMGLGDTLVRCV